MSWNFKPTLAIVREPHTPPRCAQGAWRPNFGLMQHRFLAITIVVGQWLLDRLDRLLARASILGNPVIFDPSDFPWARALEAEWTTIRREMDAILPHRDLLPNFQDISTDQTSITNDDEWKTFFFYGFGFRVDANCARCPETARLVAAIPGMQTAMFSILGPHKHIPPHCGPSKGVIRYHLALRVPRGSERCEIRIGDQHATWHEGESLVFDDTHEHEVWNDTDEDRVVLFVDVVRPLRFPVNLVNRAVLKLIAISPFVADAKRRHRAWEESVSARLPAGPVG